MSGASSIRNFFNPPVSVKSSKKSVEKTMRKSLQSIQPAASEGHLTRPEPSASKGKNASKPQKIVAHKKSVVVYEDPDSGENEENLSTEDVAPSGTCSCKCHQQDKQEVETGGNKPEQKEKTGEEEAVELMCQEDIPEDYWKVLAERRREALSETLEENEQLHQEIFKLREENQSLSEVASQAEYFANLFKSLTEENEGQSSDNQEDDS